MVLFSQTGKGVFMSDQETVVKIFCCGCAGVIVVPPKWFGKFMKVRCRSCKTLWIQWILKPGEDPNPKLVDEMLEGAKDFLSGLGEEARDFLFGKNSKN